MAGKHKDLPLVYSCSGCSSAAQTANQVALQLDRRGVAEMSCIAGVGGDVPSLVKLAKSGRTIVAIDGCALACTRNCLERHAVVPTHHVLLQHMGVKKRFHTDFDPAQADQAVAEVEAMLEGARSAPPAPPSNLPEETTP